MATLNIWRVRWRYLSAAGKLSEEFFADFVANGVAGGDGTLRPDPNDLITTRIPGNFPTPAGSSIVLRGISSAQSAFAYS